MNFNLKKDLTTFYFLVLLIFVVSCSKNQKDDDVNFIIDSSKVDLEINDKDLGISFNPPKNWDLQTATLSKKMESNFSENFFYQPIYLFFDKSTSSILSVGKVTSSDTLISKSAQINYYKNLLVKKYNSYNVKSSSFSNNNLTFNKIMFEKENLISYKIIFVNEELEIIQFDFSLPKNQYENLLSFIHASIGTIKKLN